MLFRALDGIQARLNGTSGKAFVNNNISQKETNDESYR